jgi:hypothetical protein
MPDIQKADPAARRIAVLMMVCGTVVGALLLIAVDRLRPQLESWLRQDLRARAWIGVALMAAVGPLPALGVAAYLWHLGTRVARSGRYPPPGLRVLHDTDIVTGDAARRRVRAARTLASVLALAAMFLVYFMWRVVSLLLSSTSIT